MVKGISNLCWSGVVTFLLSNLRGRRLKGKGKGESAVVDGMAKQ